MTQRRKLADASTVGHGLANQRTMTMTSTKTFRKWTGMTCPECGGMQVKEFPVSATDNTPVFECEDCGFVWV